jgi:hypothetical protein
LPPPWLDRKPTAWPSTTTAEACSAGRPTALQPVRQHEPEQVQLDHVGVGGVVELVGDAAVQDEEVDDLAEAEHGGAGGHDDVEEVLALVDHRGAAVARLDAVPARARGAARRRAGTTGRRARRSRRGG